MNRGPKKARPPTPAQSAGSPATPQTASTLFRTRGRWLLWLVGVGGMVGIGILLWLRWHSDRDDEGSELPVPAYRESRFLNTGAEARYVGVDACIECHRGKHQSYLLTAHSKAFADVDSAHEPPDGAFHHAASGRDYRVYRKDGQLRHEEVIRNADGKEIARQDHPVRYRVGSGHFAYTYLIEVDGFVHESPITWYASKRQWGMSPGYDTLNHSGFERPVKVGCLECHGGRVESPQPIHRPALMTKTIGCESCHGPGSLHVALRKTGKPVPAGDDLTIVNPDKLPRASLESICASCHLFGPARVQLRGRAVNDYRPGMLTSDYFIDYHLDTGKEEMTVVGHMEQLRRSKCYEKNETLTCLTCHEPHAREKPKDSLAYYRQKCLSCHTEQSCRIEPAQRHKTTARDSCVECHMPRGKTDIAHVSFTHHRIGMHKPAQEAPVRGSPRLEPTESVAHLSPLDQKRNLGLAYIVAAQQPECTEYAGVFQDRARELLLEVRAEGLREAATSSALATLFMHIDAERSRAFAREALEAKSPTDEPYADALILLASGEIKRGNFEAGSDMLKKLVSLRRSAEDWTLLGISLQLRKQPREALPALQKALSIRPDQATTHLKLAEVYSEIGDVGRAKDHREKGAWLTQKYGK